MYAYSLGIGEGLTPEESRLLHHPNPFVKRKRNLPVASLQYDQIKVKSMVRRF